ncbi:FUSC family protein [Thiotrichales bacterium 19S3-7]|nr:FUSC family protein [Thiotrichales bacterium 19S3-7]MCF6802360.1 FUSC family protein [Thiotrichales bacterium 19S3-11]
MNNNQSIDYLAFIFEAIKITLFCLIITGIFAVIGSNQKSLLVMFNIAVMSSAATFSPQRKSPIFLLYGAVIIILSIIAGGLIGFYLPKLSELLIIIYAILAFLLPKTKEGSAVAVTGAIMFLIFNALAFNFSEALCYSLYSLLFLPLFILFYWFFDKAYLRQNTQIKTEVSLKFKTKLESAMTAAFALLIGASIIYILKHYTTFKHLYWVGLTILVVIQGSASKTIKSSLIRIVINAIGALIIIILMTDILPNDFLINLIFLTILLFLIFALGFSYIARTLCIELFVLSFTHLLGQYHNTLAWDRIVLTLIGGLLAIIATLISYYLTALLKNFT